ncbi:MAG: thiamine phosphate synthase [Hyphomicrobiaceae bacterium]|nr:thiamine phosphate synthase [Hyphomicrobiaceae bacterium]
MSGPAEPNEPAPPRLYLVVEAGETAADRLAAALATVKPSSVLVTAASDKPLDADAVLPLIKLGQAAGVAVLIADDAQLARVTRADGAHLSNSKDILSRAAEAREILGNRFILGVDAGRSRHDAMELGESGVDYIGFGIPEFVGDRETAVERRLDLVDWWSEIFEVPCVAFDVADLADAAELADAGADFVAMRLPRGLSGADLQAFLRNAEGVLNDGMPAA